MTARNCRLAKRMRRAWARRTRLTVPRLLTSAAVPLLLAWAMAANAQAATGGQSVSIPTLAASGLEIFTGQSQKVAPPATPGSGVSEVLRGNGSRIGYKLTRGNIIADTVRVRAGGQLLRLDRDFWIDTASGSLIFAQPIQSNDSISVYYRYLDGPAPAAVGGGMPGLQLNLGQSASLGLMYNAVAGDGSGLDTSLYGLSLGGKLGGGGIAQFGGLAYFSQTKVSSNLVSTPGSAGAPAKPPTDAKTGMDHLITQNFAVNSGKLQFHADYQDVGKGFAGFQALKASNLNNKAMLDQLIALEGEKGVRRLGFGLNLANDLKSKTANGLALQWNKIEDGKGSISQQAIGYTSQNFKFNYATRDVSSTFAAFKGLREADKTQWEHEKGLKTTMLGFGLNLSNNKKGESTGAIEFGSQNFKDKSGSLNRDLLSLNSGGFGFALMNRRADAGFKRLADLSDSDKTVLALDLYRQFDPTAKAEQVTAADRLQVVKEAGLSRSSLRLDDKLGKSGLIAFSQMHITNNVAADPKEKKPGTTDSLQRESFGFATSQFKLDYTSRKADTGFTRFADLADVEKNNLALDTRRQFDPNAKIEQVTQKDRDQLAKESGISRTNLRGQLLLGKPTNSTTFSFGQYRIADGSAKDKAAQDKAEDSSKAIEGATFGITSKALQITYSAKSIGSGFNRMADLSDVDRAQFGNARGLSQSAFSGLLQINKVTKLTFSTLDVVGTKDSIASAIADALTKKTDVAEAGKAARAGFSKLNISLEAPDLMLAVGQASTDREFARSADLPFVDADKAQIEAERGTKRSNYALHFAKIKGMVVDANLYNAADVEKHRDHKVDKINAKYAVSKKTHFAFETDTDLMTVEGKKTGTDRTLISLNQEIGKSFLLDLVHDSNAVYDKDTPTPQSAKTDSLHFETPKTKVNNLNFDMKRLAYLDGRYENTTSLNLHAKPTSSLTFGYTHQEIDRGQNAPEAGAVVAAGAVATAPATAVTPAPSESSDSLDVQWQTTKQFAIVFGFSQRDTTDKNNGDTVSIGLKGDPVKDVTMVAKFDEVHTDGKNTKDVADFSFCNKKPFAIGPIRDLTITAGYASLNDKRKLQNETMTGKATWKIWKNEFVLDYGGLTKQNGEVTIARTYSFTTDPNPKKWFHGGFYYKVRTMADGTERLIRRFSADWKLNRRTNFVYTYGTLPEDDKGNVLPQLKADVSLKHSLRPDLMLEGYYRRFDDSTLKKTTSAFGFGIEGKLNRTTKLGLAYSLDILGDVASHDHSNHYHFLFDHQMDADHFVTLSTDVRSHDGKDLQDDVRANLDFRVVF